MFKYVKKNKKKIGFVDVKQFVFEVNMRPTGTAFETVWNDWLKLIY